MQLTWTAPNNQGPNEITGFKLSYKTSAGQIVVVDENIGVDQRTFEVLNLQAGMTYTFRLAAVNVFGAGPSANLTVTLPPGGEGGMTCNLYSCTCRLYSLIPLPDSPHYIPKIPHRYGIFKTGNQE